ncbi:hypothetical protein Lalb_Chr01g0007921 [Lupinus albus]|uniref:Protein LNK2 n=1 Tax=Lupinus albus TaxID=3870 RepID=A0A6A4R4I3_LUPAL|nr:hypothetical protein Lalb_Chr01g0007921 [Lupinus albus]
MFDWNDEELANIWVDPGESDDHIVPYPEASEDPHKKKEWNQEASSIKLTDQKITEAKADFHGRKLGSSSKLDNSTELSSFEYGTNSWPGLSLSSSDKNDPDPLGLGTEVSKNLEETIQHEKDVETFQGTHEGKEQVDFVDYGWANIGSFDDLDQIFSNDDSIFGHANLENSDEPWSSKDVSNCSSSPAPILLEAPSPANDLRNKSEYLETKAEYVQRNHKLFPLSYKKIDDRASHDVQNAYSTTGNMGYARGRSKPTVKEQQGKQEEKVLYNFYGNLSPSTTSSGQFGNQLAPSVVQSSSIIRQEKQHQGPETLYSNIMNPYVASSLHGNHTYPAMSMPLRAQSGDLGHQSLLSEYEFSPSIVNPLKKSMDAVKPLTMTPQEKIEKLRRRQQMQAMFAIQKQKQHLGHQVPSSSKHMTNKFSLEMQSDYSDGADPEVGDLRPLPALDPPTEQDDSNTISAAINDHSVEDTILYMLNDIISKLDVKIRLCIRDSLFRLAQSAMQRQYANDTSNTNRSIRGELEALSKEESHRQNRYAKIPDVETETNPIDRAVAHLLFHRPLESMVNHSDKLNLPISAKMQYESKGGKLENFPVGCLPGEGLKTDQEFSHQGFKNSCSLFAARPTNQFNNNPCIDTSENASNNEHADVGTHELEASQ